MSEQRGRTFFPVRRPALLVCLTFVSGLVLGRRFEISPWMLFALLLVLAALASAAIRKDWIGRHDATLLIVIITLFAGILRYEIFESRWLDNDRAALFFSNQGHVVVTGIVDDMPKPFSRSSGCSFPIRDVSITKGDCTYTLKCKVMVSCRFPLIPLPQFEDRVRLYGCVRPIRAASLPGEIDYKAYLASRNIDGQMWIGDREDIHFFGQDKPGVVSIWKNSIFRLRVRIMDILKEYLGEPWWRLAASMFLGERTGLPEQFRQNMVSSGVYHITAVSGLHTTFLVTIFFFGLKLLGMKRRTVAVWIPPMLLVFLTLVGWRVPAVRASILALGLVSGMYLRRDVDLLNILALAALSILVVRPMELFQPGFQLSFVAVASLLVLGPYCKNHLRTENAFIKIPLALLLTCSLVWVALAPLLVYHFGDLAPVTPLANLIIVPLTSIAMVFIIALIPFGFFWHPGAVVIGFVLKWLLIAFAALAGWFSHFSWANTQVSRPSIWAVCGFYLVLFLLLARRKSLTYPFQRLTIRKSHFVIAAIALTVWSGFFFSEGTDLVVHFLSLGNGDCTVIQAPAKGAMIIDGGVPDKKQYHQGESRLLATLRKLGIREIDCMVLTHADTDHIGELQNVVENMPVEMFVTNSKVDPIPIYENLMESLENQHIPITFTQAGDRIEGFRGLNIDVLSPTESLLASPKCSDNDSSVVIRVSYGEIDFLLTGDITEKVESLLLEQGYPLRSEFLKVAHHGSKYSSKEDFLRKVLPDVAVIEVGSNPYRHPHEEALTRLRNNSLLVLRTDRDGSVEVVTDGRTYSIRPWIREAIYTRQ